MTLPTAPRYDTLVEHRTSYGDDRAELNVFATREATAGFELRFDVPLVATMVEGRKRMSLDGGARFDFVPGESVLLGAGTHMDIDFPDARVDRPTRCLALALDPGYVNELCARLDDRHRLPDGETWRLETSDDAFRHTPQIQRALDRIVEAFVEDHPSRDLFIGHALEEAVVRMMQFGRERASLGTGGESRGAGALSERWRAVTVHVRAHLDRRLSVRELSRVAHMSERNFARAFKAAFGQTPGAYVRARRLERAAALLRREGVCVREVSARVGFGSLASFSRAFKGRFGVCPSGWG